MLRRQRIAAVAQRRLDPLAALPHRRVGQTDGHQVQLLPAAEVDLDGNRVGGDAEDGGGLNPEEHGENLAPVLLYPTPDPVFERKNFAAAATLEPE